MFIKYRCGYKYQLVDDYEVDLDLYPNPDIRTDFIELSSGSLTVKAGYAWDGVTGWYDSRKLLRASLVHDALYQLMRLKLLSVNDRGYADEVFRDMIREDGASWLFSTLALGALKIFGKHAVKTGARILEAP